MRKGRATLIFDQCPAFDEPAHLPPCSPSRKNQLGFAGWASMADALEGATSLTSLNGCDLYSAIRAGGLVELRLIKEWELGLWAVRFLERSASTLTMLDVRCVQTRAREIEITF